MQYADEYKDCLEYIDNYWSKIIFKPSKMRLAYKYTGLANILFANKSEDPHFIYIPHSYIVPNTKHFKRIYYWDTYFMFRGLMGTKRQKLMKEMVNNFIYLFNKYQIIPNFNAPASINRSQPPFLSSMVLDAYLAPNNLNYIWPGKIYETANKIWLKNAIGVAQSEYETVWMDKKNLYNHRVEGFNLARYGDRDIGYAHSSELESGWDMTSRFYNRCDHFLPIDLNTYLYKYETDFAIAAEILGEEKKVEKWNEIAQKRKKEINKYMWNEKEGFFFDYGYKYEKLSNFLSLASYTPLWAGLATSEQAQIMVKKLNKFETPYGLAITAQESLPKPMDISKIQRRYHPAIEEIIKPKQWDYPNIWSPLEYLTVIGLLRYGFIADAKRIMNNSLQAHSQLFRKKKTFFEKINGATGTPGTGALYKDQEGFGWTNAIFYRYVQILSSLENLDSIYISPKPQQPPYTLAILH